MLKRSQKMVILECLMIRISQAHVFLKDYVHMHQMGSHFVGGYQLNFSLTGQEIKTPILQAFGPWWS